MIIAFYVWQWYDVFNYDISSIFYKTRRFVMVERLTTLVYNT